MNKIFNSVSVKAPRYNKFDLSHEQKLSLNMGWLIPTLFLEGLPGDKLKVNTDIFIRIAPMLAPIFHRVNVFMHYFKVPKRIIWDNFEQFISPDPDKETPVAPYLSLGETERMLYMQSGTLYDYLGLPIPPGAITQPMKVSALPFRAYQQIFNDYYRDQNLRQVVEFSKGDGDSVADLTNLLTLKPRAWEKDYFTSALPWAQKGDSVTIPSAPAEGTPTYFGNQTGALAANAGGLTVGGVASTMNPVNGATINDLRRAEKLQQFLERAATGGARYKEALWNYFKVKSRDSRLQRAEYLGGGKQPVIISEQVSTAWAVDGDSNNIPQGNLAGHGISAGNGNFFKTYCEEHCYIMGIMSVIPRTAYCNGVDRLWKRDNYLDYYWPQFANIGEQPVEYDEIYRDFTENDAYNSGTWGYQSRYAEYKFKKDSVHGDFRDTLTYWHMGRMFDSLPGLNADFVQSDPTHRIFAVTNPNFHKLYAQIYHAVDAQRLMPVFGTPTI